MSGSQSYIHVVTEPGAGAVLQPTLMHRAVQDAWKHRVPRMLVLHRGVVETPPPATAAGRGEGGWRKGKCYCVKKKKKKKLCTGSLKLWLE